MSGSVTLVLPEPPSLNDMIDLAKKRRRGRPIVYSVSKAEYELRCTEAVRKCRNPPPREAWKRWRVDRIVFRVHNERDLIELTAGLKWPVDWLVNYGIVEDDSPRHLVGPLPDPQQIIARSNRGVEISISKCA